jgi:hypothetical protein
MCAKDGRKKERMYDEREKENSDRRGNGGGPACPTCLEPTSRINAPRSPPSPIVEHETARPPRARAPFFGGPTRLCWYRLKRRAAPPTQGREGQQIATIHVAHVPRPLVHRRPPAPSLPGKRKCVCVWCTDDPFAMSGVYCRPLPAIQHPQTRLRDTFAHPPTCHSRLENKRTFSALTRPCFVR